MAFARMNRIVLSVAVALVVVGTARADEATLIFGTGQNPDTVVVKEKHLVVAIQELLGANQLKVIRHVRINVLMRSSLREGNKEQNCG